MENKQIYHVTFDEADRGLNADCVDKSKAAARQLTDNIAFRIIIIFLILADIGILIASFILEQKEFDFIAFGFSCIFLIEIILRLYGIGIQTYFCNWINIVDFLVVFVTSVISIVDISLATSTRARYLIVIRLLRLPRIISLLLRNYKKFIKSSRHVTSENKRRFQSDGYDLDLCYVTDRVIAMSFPSSGFTALYRNSITDVAKFFNSKYGSNYKIYNLCEERSYDTKIFNNQVERYMIKDHNVPRLEEILKFAKSSRDWLSLSDQNIIAVHCKGGKGRTGTMICVHLIDSGVFDNAELCLQYFGQRRTDLLQGKKFQGVETPSQNRYVGYFETIKKSPDFKIPNEKLLKIEKIEITGTQNLYYKSESEIMLQIIQGYSEGIRERIVLEMTLGDPTKCQVTSDKEYKEHLLKILISDCPTLHDDVKIKFLTKNKKVPEKYDKCAFFFWFHTGFIENNRLSLSREQLDNPHKKTTWNIYNSEFKVDIFFKSDSLIE